MADKNFPVMASVHLHGGVGWNEWDSIPPFQIRLDAATSLETVARRARMIVDRKGVEKVDVEVLNDATGYYEKFSFEPTTF